MALFSKDNQPKDKGGRGKAKKTLIIDALKRAGKSEDGFYDLLIQRALDPDDQFAVKEILTRINPVPRAVMPTVDFDFDVNASPVNQVNQIIHAASEGSISPDVASIFIQAIRNMTDIEVNTELKARIEKLEGLLSA